MGYRTRVELAPEDSQSSMLPLHQRYHPDGALEGIRTLDFKIHNLLCYRYTNDTMKYDSLARGVEIRAAVAFCTSRNDLRLSYSKRSTSSPTHRSLSRLPKKG